MVGRSFWARFRFAPLRYNDGTPCYFRAACLTVLALCLVAQGLVIGARKDAQSAQLAQAGENASSAQSLQQDQLTQGVSGTLQVGQSVSATAVGPSLSSATAPVSSHLAIAPNGTNATLGERSLTATSSLSTAHVAPPRSELDVTLQPSGFWSMLGLSSDEDKLKAQLLKNRRAETVRLTSTPAARLTPAMPGAITASPSASRPSMTFRSRLTLRVTSSRLLLRASRPKTHAPALRSTRRVSTLPTIKTVLTTSSVLKIPRCLSRLWRSAKRCSF